MQKFARLSNAFKMLQDKRQALCKSDAACSQLYISAMAAVRGVGNPSAPPQPLVRQIDKFVNLRKLKQGVNKR